MSDETDLSAILRLAVKAASPSLDAKLQQLTVSQPDQRIKVRGDGIVIARKIARLLQDESKRAKQGDEILMSEIDADAHVRLAVSDTTKSVVHLAALLEEPDPSPPSLYVKVFDAHADCGADAGKAVDHQSDPKPDL